MKRFDVTVLTCEKYLHPEANTPYVKNVLHEDQLVVDALKKQGLKTHRMAWSDSHFDWADTHYVLFRTTWDYFERAGEFLQWLDHTSQNTKMINSYLLARWNLDKHYLQHLSEKGVNIVPTIFLEPGEKRTLAELHQEHHLHHTILKPAVSAAARETYQVREDNLSQHEATFKRLINEEAMLLQPFIASVVERGEISLMMIGDQFSHAVLKIAKPGDFRVQDDFGGTVHPYEPTQEEIDLAQLAIQSCPEKPLYARVDLVNDTQGKPALSEIELVEPEMWFRRRPQAAEELAQLIAKTWFT